MEGQAKFTSDMKCAEGGAVLGWECWGRSLWLSGSHEGSGYRDKLSFLGPRKAEAGHLRECMVPSGAEDGVKEKPQLPAVGLPFVRPRLHQVSSLPNPTFMFVTGTTILLGVASPLSG